MKMLEMKIKENEKIKNIQRVWKENEIKWKVVDHYA